MGLKKYLGKESISFIVVVDHFWVLRTDKNRIFCKTDFFLSLIESSLSWRKILSRVRSEKVVDFPFFDILGGWNFRAAIDGLQRWTIYFRSAVTSSKFGKETSAVFLRAKISKMKTIFFRKFWKANEPLFLTARFNRKFVHI